MAVSSSGLVSLQPFHYLLFASQPQIALVSVSSFAGLFSFLYMCPPPGYIILLDLSSSSCLYNCVSSAHLFLCSLCHYYCMWFRGHSLLFKKDWRKINSLISEECNFLAKQRLFGVYAGVIFGGFMTASLL